MERHSSGVQLGHASAVSTLEGVSTVLLLCRKNLSIYPPGHPRLDRALHSLRERLVEYEKAEGVPFRFETENVLNEDESVESSRSRHDRLSLARILQLRLVSALTIRLQASDDELLELVSVLHDNFLKPSDESHADPGSWDNIEMTFYEEEELPDGCSPVIAVLERAAGLRRHEELDPLLNDLPEEVVERLREHLARPEFLRRVSRLRTGFRARVATTEREETNKLDLVSESLRMALQSNTPRRRDVADAILRDLDDFLTFAEKHVDFLAGETGSAPEGVGSSDPSDTIHSLAVDRETVETGALVQSLKQRMGFLFRTARQPLAVGASDDDEVDPTHQRRAKKDREATLDRIEFPAEARLPPITQLAPAANEVVVSLELLLHETASFTGRWDAIEARLLAAVRAEGAVGEVTQQLSLFLARQPLRQARKLLFELLGGLDSAEEIAAQLSPLVEQEEGRQNVRDFLGWLVASTPKRAIQLLVTLCTSGSPELRTLADERLIQFGGDPELLMVWLVNDPDCIRSEIGRRYVLGLSLENLRAVLKHFFANAAADRVSSFLAHLPMDLRGVERVLVAAVDYASPTHRRFALRQLAAFPSPSSVKSLEEIVKLNNLRERPDLDDTKAALVGLAGMDSEEARQFLHQIFDRRKGLVRYYKRSIRNALREVLEQKEANRCP